MQICSAAQLIEEADKIRIRAAGGDSPLHLAAASLWKSRSIGAPRPLQACVDVAALVARSNSGGELLEAAEEITCGIYNRNLDYSYEWLMDRLPIEMQSRTPLYIFIDLEKYGVEECLVSGLNLEATTHASSLLLWPKSPIHWHAFHFNPHGHVSLDTVEHETYRTRYRMQVTPLKQPLDKLVLDVMLTGLRARTPNIRIDFDWYSPKHNYLGPNLQIADELGICFAFCFNLYTRLVKNKLDPSTTSVGYRGPRTLTALMCRDEFEYLLAFALLCDVCPSVDVLRLHDMTSHVENAIEQQGEYWAQKQLRVLFAVVIPHLLPLAAHYPKIFRNSDYKSAAIALQTIYSKTCDGDHCI